MGKYRDYVNWNGIPFACGRGDRLEPAMGGAHVFPGTPYLLDLVSTLHGVQDSALGRVPFVVSV